MYKPGHHANLAFYRAAKNGVRAHHRGFGDIPPQTQITPSDAAHIIVYVRMRQEHSGIK